MKQRAPFPPITLPDAARLPDGASYSTTRNAGCCLIALLFKPLYKGPESHRVVIRNCYKAGRGAVVENMREYLPHSSKIGRTGVLLARLLDLGMEVVKPPFMLSEPRHNCIEEMTPAEFAWVWETNQDTSPDCVEAAKDHKEHKTPTLQLIQQHWNDQALYENWTPDRIRRLCALWGLTTFELAELIQWAPGAMDSFLNGMGLRLPGPVAVWFHFLENMRFGLPAFPDLPRQQEAKAS